VRPNENPIINNIGTFTRRSVGRNKRIQIKTICNTSPELVYGQKQAFHMNLPIKITSEKNYTPYTEEEPIKKLPDYEIQEGTLSTNI